MSGAAGGLSKAAKKNKKRHAKKAAAAHGGGSTAGTANEALTPASLLPLLKEQLEEAKIAKDVTLASDLREQIWVLNDIIAGVKTNMSDAELKPIMAKLEALMEVKGQQAKSSESAPSSGQPTAPSAEPEKRIRNLRKKLDQIEKLKERKAKGEKLEDKQLEKIEAEDKVIEEIEELEALLEKTTL